MRNLEDLQENTELAKKLRMMEERRWYKLYTFVFPTMIVCIIVVAAINFLTGKTSVAIIELIALPLFVLPYVLVLRRKNQKLVKGILVAGMLAFMALPLLPSMHLTAWYSMPITIVAALFLLLGRSRSALIIPIAVAALSAAFLLRYTVADDPLPVGAQINFYVLVFVMAYISYFNESTKAQYQDALNDAAGRLEKQSNADDLTRLFNRRYIDRRIRSEWNRHTRSGNPLSLILCDIDYFKEINDSAGHPAGDECLKSVAATIRLAATRDADVPARYGGDEFALLLPASGTDAALAVAKRLRTLLAAADLPHPAFENRLVSLSIGICTMNPSMSRSPVELIAAADREVYRSKEEGRDRISAVSI